MFYFFIKFLVNTVKSSINFWLLSKNTSGSSSIIITRANCKLCELYLRQFVEHILKVTLLKSNLLLISSEQIMLLLKDFTAFFFNSCETNHVMNILGGGRSYLEPKGKELSGSSGCVHLVLLMRVGAYSSSRRLQKLSSLSFARFQDLLDSLFLDAS